jgi:hypothetical protein
MRAGRYIRQGPNQPPDCGSRPQRFLALKRYLLHPRPVLALPT